MNIIKFKFRRTLINMKLRKILKYEANYVQIQLMFNMGFACHDIVSASLLDLLEI